MNRVRVLALGLAASISLWGAAADAQTYPTRPIRLIVPQSAGGSTDLVARPLAKRLSEALGQPVIVENRPGAGSVIGTDLVAKAAPDGYTLLAVAASFTISPSLYQRLPFDPVRDFTPISLLASFPNVLVVHSSLPVRSVRDLVALALSRPGHLNYGSSGIGTGTHLSMELFKHLTGTEMVNVAYKGGAPLVNALLSGEVQVGLATISTALPHIKTGKLRALAVTSSKRSSALPDVPTVAESGVPGYDYSSWIGLLAPANTPRHIVSKLEAEAAGAARSPEIAAILALEGAKPVGDTPEHFATVIRAEIAHWKKLVDAAGIKAE